MSEEQARALVASLTFEEKIDLMHLLESIEGNRQDDGAMKAIPP